MATAYTWHPRVDLNHSVWPRTQPIMEDELLTSWLVRTALAHGCSPLALTSIIWPKWRALSGDLDRGLSSDRAISLASVAGCSVSEVSNCCLGSIAEAISGRPIGEATWPWILVRGSRNLRSAAGLQLCPLCFAEGPPYYRISGRLAWHFSCPRHHVWLIDRCPSCWTALQPQRLLPPDQDCGACHLCGYRFALSPVESTCESDMLFQQAADECLGGYCVAGAQLMTTAEWFLWARVVQSFIRCASLHPTQSISAVLCDLGVQMLAIIPSGLALEALAVRERAELLAQTWKVMSFDHEILAQVFSAHALSRSALPLPRGCDAPSSISGILEALKSGSSRHRKSGAGFHGVPNVVRAWARLQRKFSRDG